MWWAEGERCPQSRRQQVSRSERIKKRHSMEGRASHRCCTQRSARPRSPQPRSPHLRSRHQPSTTPRHARVDKDVSVGVSQSTGERRRLQKPDLRRQRRASASSNDHDHLSCPFLLIPYTRSHQIMVLTVVATLQVKEGSQDIMSCAPVNPPPFPAGAL